MWQIFSVLIVILEGEGSLANKLGTISFDGIPLAPRGILQIEVTFDIDANRILTVLVSEKSTGIQSKIINDNCRMRKENIERVQALSALESYVFSLKSTLEEETVKQKLNEFDHIMISDAISSTLRWLDSNALAEKDEFEHRRKKLESVASSIM